MIEPKRVSLSESYVKQLGASAESQRPLERRAVKNFSMASLQAELLPDLALRFGKETVLVEVKTKGGVLSRSALVHPDITNALKKFTVPAYYFRNYFFPCRKERMRRFSDAEHRYDPTKMLLGIDIEGQLKILHNERSRSLRVFYRGARLSHNSAANVCNEGFCSTALGLAAKAILNEKSQGDDCFSKLLAIQRADYIDNIGAGLLLKHLMDMVGKKRAYDMIGEYVHLPGTEKWGADDEKQYRASKSIICYKTAEEGKRLHSVERYLRATEEVADMKPSVCAKILAEFMQAASARDCSVMISMCREDVAEPRQRKDGRQDGPGGIVQCNGVKWVYSAHVIDTGAKPVDKILHKWPALDLEYKRKVSAAGGLDKLMARGSKASCTNAES